MERLSYAGGNWNNGANAGVFALNGNNPRSNSNTNIGFRAAFLSFARRRTPMGGCPVPEEERSLFPLPEHLAKT